MSDSYSAGFCEDGLRLIWLEQIQAEFVDICYQYRLDLALPVFELSDSNTCYGSWKVKYRLITISSQLIQAQPWPVTIQVLKHEMAHQICSDIFDAPEAGHGPLFRKACLLLGLSGPFSRATSDSAEFLDKDEDVSFKQTEEGRRILARVEKLLALAGSDNEHEAALAMQRAGEILSRHNLKRSSPEQEIPYRHLTIYTGKQRMPSYMHGISSLLLEYFFVKVVCSSSYDPLKNVRFKTIEIFGRPENVAVAEYCYAFLLQKLESLWRDNRHRFPRGGQRARNSYFHGVLAGFRQKMAEGRKHDVPGACPKSISESALVVADDSGLQDFIAVHYPRLTKARKRKIQIRADAYQEAVDAGKKLVFNRAVEESSSSRGRLA